MAKRADLLIVTPLRDEFRVFNELCPVRDLIDIDGDYVNKVTLPIPDLDAIVFMLGRMGNTESASAIQKLLGHYHPRLIVLLGISGGLADNLLLGDVVIADDINEFPDSSKIIQKENYFTYLYSGRHWSPEFNLINSVRQFEKNHPTIYQNWQNRARMYQADKHFTPEMLAYVKLKPEYEVGPIATGPSIVASEAYKIELHGIDRNFLAVETEAAGVAAAAERRTKKIPFLLIRGISDTAEADKKKLDKIGGGIFREYAVYNAVTFLLALLEAGKILSPRSRKETSPRNTLLPEQISPAVPGFQQNQAKEETAGEPPGKRSISVTDIKKAASELPGKAVHEYAVLLFKIGDNLNEVRAKDINTVDHDHLLMELEGLLSKLYSKAFRNHYPEDIWGRLDEAHSWLCELYSFIEKHPKESRKRPFIEKVKKVGRILMSIDWDGYDGSITKPHPPRPGL